MEGSNGHTKEQEPGYRAVLVREETKKALQAFRAALPGRDLAQERRLATAAVQLVLQRPDLHAAVARAGARGGAHRPADRAFSGRLKPTPMPDDETTRPPFMNTLLLEEESMKRNWFAFLAALLGSMFIAGTAVAWRDGPRVSCRYTRF